MERTATPTDTPGAEQLGDALEFAREAHSGQTRKQNGHPYIEHPVAVEGLLAAHGFNGSLLVAAYLHDTVEKTEIEAAEIERVFGSEVAAIVDALSEDGSIEGYAGRKRALRSQAIEAGHEATVLYAADRLSNMRDWHALEVEDRHRAAERLGTTLEERLGLWGEDVEALADTDPGLPFLAEVEIELRALRAEAG